MGWLPFRTTSSPLFHLFPSVDKAIEAADKYIALPLQEDGEIA